MMALFNTQYWKGFLFWMIAAGFLYHPVQAQTRLTVDHPASVSVGEQFQLTWTMNTMPDSEIILPSLSGFRILFGPSTSQQQSFSSVNGRTTRNVQVSYTYVVQALKEGSHEIGSAILHAEGKEYRSDPFTINVVQGSQPPPQGNPPTTGPSPGNAGSSSQIQSENDLFVRVLTDKTSAYPGEPILVTIKLFTRENLSSLGNAQFPSFNGFFKQDIDTPPINGLESESVNGIVYGTAVLKKYVLFPQKSGNIVIDPFSLECIIQRRASDPRSFFDDFFGTATESVPVLLTSKPVEIRVKPLPQDTRPGIFDGAVGQFQIQSSLDKTSLKTNEAATLSITISGIGNIRFVNLPTPDFPVELEVYDPKNQIQINPSGIGGNKVFEYVIIPRTAGTFSIPPVEFSYFDPSAASYKTLRTQTISLAVEEGSGEQNLAYSGISSREDLKVLGQDIRYLKSGKFPLKPSRYFFIGSATFWLLYLLALSLFLLMIFLRRRHIKKYSDLVRLKNKQANRFATRRLKRARSHMLKDQKEAFFTEVTKAMWGYLGDKFNISPADLSRENARASMEQKGISQDLVQSFMDIVDTCEYARYASGSSGVSLQEMYQNAVHLIGLIHNQLKNKI